MQKDDQSKTTQRIYDEVRRSQIKEARDRIIQVVNGLLLGNHDGCTCRDGDLCQYHAVIYYRLLEAGKHLTKAMNMMKRPE